MSKFIKRDKILSPTIRENSKEKNSINSNKDDDEDEFIAVDLFFPKANTERLINRAGKILKLKKFHPFENLPRSVERQVLQNNNRDALPKLNTKNNSSPPRKNKHSPRCSQNASTRDHNDNQKVNQRGEKDARLHRGRKKKSLNYYGVTENPLTTQKNFQKKSEKSSSSSTSSTTTTKMTTSFPSNGGYNDDIFGGGLKGIKVDAQNDREEQHIYDTISSAKKSSVILAEEPQLDDSKQNADINSDWEEDDEKQSKSIASSVSQKSISIPEVYNDDEISIERTGVATKFETDLNTQMDYEISVLTGDRLGASCHVPITMAMTGSKDCSPKLIALEKSSSNEKPFRKGQLDVFRVTMPFDLGSPIRSVEIGHDSVTIGSDWFLEYITVRNLQSGHSNFFPCQRWISIRSPDKKTRVTLGSSTLMDNEQLIHPSAAQSQQHQQNQAGSGPSTTFTHPENALVLNLQGPIPVLMKSEMMIQNAQQIPLQQQQICQEQTSKKTLEEDSIQPAVATSTSSANQIHFIGSEKEGALTVPQKNIEVIVENDDKSDSSSSTSNKNPNNLQYVEVIDHDSSSSDVSNSSTDNSKPKMTTGERMEVLQKTSDSPEATQKPTKMITDQDDYFWDDQADGEMNKQFVENFVGSILQSSILDMRKIKEDEDAVEYTRQKELEHQPKVDQNSIMENPENNKNENTCQISSIPPPKISGMYGNTHGDASDVESQDTSSSSSTSSRALSPPLIATSNLETKENLELNDTHDQNQSPKPVLESPILTSQTGQADVENNSIELKNIGKQEFSDIPPPLYQPVKTQKEAINEKSDGDDRSFSHTYSSTYSSRSCSTCSSRSSSSNLSKNSSEKPQLQTNNANPADKKEKLKSNIQLDNNVSNDKNNN